MPISTECQLSVQQPNPEALKPRGGESKPLWVFPLRRSEELGVQYLNCLLPDLPVDDERDVGLGGALAHHAHVDALAAEYAERL